MKKVLAAIAVLAITIVVGLYGLNNYRKTQKQQLEMTSHLLASCVNQGILSLFQLQANDWRKNPEFYLQQQRALNEAVEALPQKILDGKPFKEWKYAVDICDKLTRNSNLQHITIFRPLTDLASFEMSDAATFKNRKSLRKRKKTIGALRESAQAADRYLKDLRSDINTQVQTYGFSAEEKAFIQKQINTEILDYYQQGNFSLNSVNVYLERLSTFYKLMAENPKAYTVRSGSLYFYNPELRGKVEGLNRVILQGENAFFANYTQILVRKQISSPGL
ncbi:hypothetical protein [Microbulbifer sp. THAF38]|uniref:hypothetical protein n=1 Tax=Microbulbifer sp. THAF38 TaxID=2587856 RepID=UPI001268947C|nr:hypothetical protein [Microbulbifer sp. THAF38]QFT53000.1 hypothetical protein FIU95_00200 [Microbulbifer sp. THAF38]